MYVARYWRMQASRYQLEATQYEDDSVSLQNRPIVVQEITEENVVNKPTEDSQEPVVHQQSVA